MLDTEEGENQDGDLVWAGGEGEEQILVFQAGGGGQAGGCRGGCHLRAMEMAVRAAHPRHLSSTYNY